MLANIIFEQIDILGSRFSAQGEDLRIVMTAAHLATLCRELGVHPQDLLDVEKGYQLTGIEIYIAPQPPIPQVMILASI